MDQLGLPYIAMYGRVTGTEEQRKTTEEMGCPHCIPTVAA